MSQFEKAVKLSDEQFLRAVGVDKTTFNLILERVAVYLESVREERPMKKRGTRKEIGGGISRSPSIDIHLFAPLSNLCQVRHGVWYQ